MMERATVVGIVTLLSIHGALAADKYATYANARFGYAIAYPVELLVAEPESDNGDGRAFDAKAGQARFLVYAGFNSLAETPDAIAETAEASCPAHHAEYRVIRPKLVAISCKVASNIIYQKTTIAGDVLTTLSAIYPVTERLKWNAVVSQMVKSLVPAKSTPASSAEVARPQIGSVIAKQAHGATDKAFTDCMLSKAKLGSYSSADGGRSSVRLLGECPTEWNAYVDACVGSGDTEGNCTLKSGVLAQAALKLLGK